MVVMVIVSFVSTLAFQSLSITSKAFTSINRSLSRFSEKALPTQWFSRSLKGSVLYHPNEIYVSGSAENFTFITTTPPSEFLSEPELIEWQILEVAGSWSLSFIFKQQEYVIAEFGQQIAFEYFYDNKWQQNFKTATSRLPDAVRIIDHEGPLFLATPIRNPKADYPTELAVFGEYEF